MDISKEIEKLQREPCLRFPYVNERILAILTVLDERQTRHHNEMINYIYDKRPSPPGDESGKIPEGFKPCPFCGSNDIEWSLVNSNERNQYSCKNCGASSGCHITSLSARIAWNRRS